jgi:hypothetical protein
MAGLVAALVMTLSSCTSLLPGAGSSVQGVSSNSTTPATLADLVTAVSTQQQADKTSHFTIKITREDETSEAQVGDGSLRVTQAAVDYTLNLPQNENLKVSVIGPTASVSGDPDSGHRVESVPVQSVLDPGNTTPQTLVFINNMWFTHPETLNNAFTMVGSAADQTPGSNATRYRLTGDLAKAADQIDRQLGFPAVAHPTAQVSLDLVVGPDSRLTAATVKYDFVYSDGTPKPYKLDYTFSNWGDPVDIVVPT